MMSTDAPSLRNAAPPSLRDEYASRNGRGIALAGLGFGIYFLLIALLMLWPHPEENVLAVIFIALVGVFFTVTGAVGVARSAKRVREYNATRGGLVARG
jgi:choline-glycine betaine transporter